MHNKMYIAIKLSSMEHYYKLQMIKGLYEPQYVKKGLNVYATGQRFRPVCTTVQSPKNFTCLYRQNKGSSEVSYIEVEIFAWWMAKLCIWVVEIVIYLMHPFCMAWLIFQIFWDTNLNCNRQLWQEPTRFSWRNMYYKPSEQTGQDLCCFAGKFISKFLSV